jgi:hypothetical protein
MSGDVCPFTTGNGSRTPAVPAGGSQVTPAATQNAQLWMIGVRFDQADTRAYRQLGM